MMEVALTPHDIAITWLLIGAIFFAMRSCEYIYTSTPEKDRKTKTVRVGDITFKKNCFVIPHTSSSILPTADVVIIIFRDQKNGDKGKQVHMFRTDDDILCPVKAWAATVTRIRAIPRAHDKVRVYTFYDQESKKVSRINATQVRNKIRAIVQVLGEEYLGFGPDDVGLHSIRSGGAMAMFLSGTREIIIMHIGRWKSLAFLEYIREQVENFTAGVSSNMIHFEHFHNLNAQSSTSQQTDSHTNNENGIMSVPHTTHFTPFGLGEQEWYGTKI